MRWGIGDTLLCAIESPAAGKSSRDSVPLIMLITCA